MRRVILALIAVMIFICSDVCAEEFENVKYFVPDYISEDIAKTNGKVFEKIDELYITEADTDNGYVGYLKYDEDGRIIKNVIERDGVCQYINISYDEYPFRLSEELPQFTFEFKIGESLFSYNNEIREIDENFDVVPYIDKTTGRTMVPIRCFAECIGRTVQWDENTGEILLIKKADTKSLSGGIFENVIKIKIGSAKIYLGREEFISDAVPVIVNDRTFVPLRVLGELFMCNVNWNEEEKIVTVFQKTISEIFEYECWFNVIDGNMLKVGTTFNNKTNLKLTLEKPTPTTYITLDIYNKKGEHVYPVYQGGTVAGFPSDQVFEIVDLGYTEKFENVNGLEEGTYTAKVRIRGCVIMPDLRVVKIEREYSKRFSIHK